jgi:hypothetical protein
MELYLQIILGIISEGYNTKFLAINFLPSTDLVQVLRKHNHMVSWSIIVLCGLDIFEYCYFWVSVSNIES